MANVAFVDGLIEQMVEEVRVTVFGLADPCVNPREELPAIARRWTRTLAASNPYFRQRMSPENQNAWLRAHGYGANAPDDEAPVLALVTQTIERFVQAYVAYGEGRIKQDQAEFWIDTAVEDCSCMLRGLENRAD